MKFTNINISDALLQFEEDNYFQSFFEDRSVNSRKPSIELDQDLYDKFPPEARKLIIDQLYNKECRNREKKPGPFETAGWNAKFKEDVEIPYKNGNLQGNDLRNSALQFFRGIPGITNSPLLCFKVLEIFNQHKNSIMSKLDPPIFYSDILDSDEAQNHFLEIETEGVGVGGGGGEATDGMLDADADLQVGDDEDILAAAAGGSVALLNGMDLDEMMENLQGNV